MDLLRWEERKDHSLMARVAERKHIILTIRKDRQFMAFISAFEEEVIIDSRSFVYLAHAKRWCMNTLEKWAKAIQG